MRKQYDDFTQMKLKEMCKSISDMTYTYLDPETQLPTKVPASHYEKILDQVKEQYMGEITSRQFLTIMYNQLTALKKEDDKYFQQALLCMDLGINPKDMRVDEQLALSMTYDFIYDRQKNMKKDYHFLDTEVINAFKETKDNPVIQAQAIRMTTDYEESQEQTDIQKVNDMTNMINRFELIEMMIMIEIMIIRVKYEKI